MKFFTFGSKDIGIDLGTANILVTLKGRGIILKEPSVVAIDRRTGNIMATGNEAKEMLGRTPEQIKAVRPLKDGVIADFTATQLMLKNIIQKVEKRYNVGRPRVVVGVPSGITEVEERAVEESVIQAGAKEVYLIEEPMAAAIGASLDVAEPSGSIIVDIGGGTTEVAVISLGGIVVSHSLRVAGDELDEDIVNYVKREMNLAIGETTAEQIKMQLGCAMPLMTEMSMEVRGRDLTDGLPRNEKITSTQVEEAIKESISKIVDIVKSGLIAGMAVIVDFAIVAIVENLIGTKQTRLSDFTRIFLNIKIILRNTKDVLTETCNLYPENLFIIWIIALLAILFVYEIKNKDELIKEKVSVILKYILLVILAIFSSSVIYIISMSGFWAGRLRFAIGSLIGILFLYIATQTRLFFRKEAKEKTFVSDVTIVLLVIYFLTVVVFNVFFMYEHRQVNKLEKQESERILEYISKYEEETKNEVKKVQVITIECEEEKSYYSQVAAHNVLTYNGLSANWSAVGCLNFFSQKELIEEKGEISQEILYEVMDNVEDEVCIGDTIYMKCYMY